MASDTTDGSATSTDLVSIVLSTLPTVVESAVSTLTYELFSSATTTASATSSSLSSVSSSVPPTTLSTTVSRRPSETLSSSSATPSASTNVGPSPYAYVAGIVTGIAAAVVVVVLAVLFVKRRRAQGKALFRRKNSGRSSAAGSQRVFPEEAWLYDPKVTARDGPGAPREGADHADDQSRTRLLPEPREGTTEIASGPPSPSLHPARASSPLLAPEPIGAMRGESPQGRARSGSTSPTGQRSASSSPSGRRARGSFANSRTDLTRPMSAIYEEPYKMSIDARQSLLAPPDRSTQRHST